MIDASRYTVTPMGCWEWNGAKQRAGYGILTYRNKQWLAHRLMYEQLIGPIPDGLQIDHLCRNRLCCNPSHLEPVTGKENVRRGALPALRRNSTKRTTPAQREWAVEQVLLGRGIREVGRQLGIDYTLIISYMRRRGFKAKHPEKNSRTRVHHHEEGEVGAFISRLPQ